MNRTKRSIVWKIPLDEFQKIVKSSQSIADICRHLGIAVAGANHKTILKRIVEDAIDASHIPRGLGSNKGRTFNNLPSKAIPLDKIMIENSTYYRGHLKKRLLKDGLLRNECYVCGIGPQWNKKKLVMVLDHINGLRNDHRLENLRMLCPNCNSQQPTFAGGNCKKVALQRIELCSQP